jgi:hypothetical protein
MHDILFEQVKKQFIEYGIQVINWTKIALIQNCKSNPGIAQFKNRHKGKRCFLIGNGPSLRSDDLTKLHKNSEITFGCNYINKIFPYTKWRPNYYIVDDSYFIRNNIHIINKIDIGVKFIPLFENIHNDELFLNRTMINDVYGEIIYYNRLPPSGINHNFHFSEDPSKAIVISGTVMFPMLQISAYMGFNEIYLLGVDNTQGIPYKQEIYFSRKRHFYEDNYKEFQKHELDYDYRYITEILNDNAYKCANKFSHSNGFRIYNATRDGELEVFERRDFDSLF